jgi:hypothetical protein
MFDFLQVQIIFPCCGLYNEKKISPNFPYLFIISSQFKGILWVIKSRRQRSLPTKPQIGGMKMFWKWFWKALVVLLVLTIFVGSGIAIYRAGYAQGLTAAVWTAEGEEGVLPRQSLPYIDPHFRPYGRPRMFFPGFLLFFGFILLMFVLGGVGRMFRYKMWRSEGMPYSPDWGHGWHKHHHRHDWDEPSSKSKPSKGDEPGSEADPSS